MAEFDAAVGEEQDTKEEEDEEPPGDEQRLRCLAS